MRLESPGFICNRDFTQSYPILKGRPILFASGEPEVKFEPEDHLSNQIPSRILDEVSALPGSVLHLSAGGSDRKPPNFVELEYSVFRNTDIVADAHALPFLDNTFDAVVSLNAFEHYHSPERVAEEILRVLKPQGRLFLHTAFIQALHQEPHHYFNATEHGVLRWFRAFEIQSLGVSENFHPATSFAFFFSQFLDWTRQTAGDQVANELSSITLGEIADLWCAKPSKLRTSRAFRALSALPESCARRFAGGFELLARKPFRT